LKNNSKIIYFVYVRIKKHDIYKLSLFQITILKNIKWAEYKRENEREKDYKDIPKLWLWHHQYYWKYFDGMNPTTSGNVINNDSSI